MVAEQNHRFMPYECCFGVPGSSPRMYVRALGIGFHGKSFAFTLGGRDKKEGAQG
jgi:hypothetical protein